jgi:hypothetical protein
MPVPQPIQIFRLVHIENLPIILSRQALHAPNHCPNDGLVYKTIHNADVQAQRHVQAITCGPQGSIHDYVPFYFGPLSVMLLNLKTGRVADYNEGQSPLVYLVSTVERIEQAEIPFVYSDGHGLASFTNWYSERADFNKVDWDLVGARYWSDRPEDNDRQRRKQAEFLAWREVPFHLIRGIGVFDQAAQAQVENLLTVQRCENPPQGAVKRDWYYY